MSGLDHVGYAVGDVERSAAFFDAALGALGLSRQMEFEFPGGKGIGYGDTRPFFWINSGTARRDHVHVAFRAKSRAEVDAFHKAAIAAGGRDNGGPGIREQYHPTYYGAFVLDPDGHNIEAVCHGPA